MRSIRKNAQKMDLVRQSFKIKLILPFDYYMTSISVIIPSYNRAHLLPRCLDSVLAQHYAASEIIVIDDGSTDNTEELIKTQYPSVEYIKQIQQGVSAARNTGIKQSQSEWIALLDSDDEWHADKLATQIHALNAKPEYLLCHTDEIWIRDGKRVNSMNKHKKYGGDVFSACLPLCAISPSSVLINKTLFTEIGYFDESLPACEDYDLWLRICSRYPVLFIEQQLLTKYGGHDDQLSRKHWGMDRFRIYALDKILCTNTLNSEQEYQAINTLLYKTEILQKGALKHNNESMIKYCSSMLQKYSRQDIAIN